MWFLGEEVFPSKQEERKTSAPAGKTSTLKQSILSQILTSTLLVHFPSPDLYWPSFRQLWLQYTTDSLSLLEFGFYKKIYENKKDTF